MLSTAHTIISLPFAFLLSNPILIFIAAIFFHLFADSLLHWNIYPDQFKRFPTLLIALDVVGGLVVAVGLLQDQAFTLPVLAAIAGGNLPDALHVSWELLPQSLKNKTPSWAMKALTFHDGIQHETDIMWHGMITQIVLVSIALALVLRLA